jgi:hypothetical protein
MAGRSTAASANVVVTIKDRLVTEMKGCANRQVAFDYAAS